jgi:DNA-binding SARP family transcriptional activator
MRAAAIQRRYESALEFGRRILAMDVLRESVQRDVMLLLVLNGQRAEAIRNYQRFIVVLRSELDIEPMPETTRLHNEIVSGDIFERMHEYAAAQFGLHAA